MTLDSRTPYTEMTPADGVETTARRLIDNVGAPIAPDEAHKYIRVIGESLTNLEPHFWGEGLAIAKFPDDREKKDHYYITRAIKRLSITVCKRDKTEKDALRTSDFDYTKDLQKYLTKDQVTPWHQIPERYGKRRYQMYLAQEHPQALRAVGFPQSAIDTCARGKKLGSPVGEDGKRLKRNGKPVVFHVHHRIPLQAGGSNSVENLCLVDGDVHNPFFHKGDDPVLNNMKSGEVRVVALTVPHDNIHVIAVGLNAQVFVDEHDTRKDRAA